MAAQHLKMNQVRALGDERVIRQPGQARGVGHHNAVAFDDQPLNQFLPVGGAQIDGGRTLSLVETGPVDRRAVGGERPAVGVRRTADRVDANHLGAQLAQRHSAQRRRDEAGHLDDGETSKRRGHYGVDPLENRCESLSAADAHGFQPVAGVAPVQFAGQRRQHPAAGRADRVAQRDSRAVHVRALLVGGAEAPLPHHGKRLRGECLVELDQVDVAQLQSGFGKCDCSVAGTGPIPITLGAHARGGPGHQPHQRSEAELRGSLRGGHETHGRRVVLAAGIAGRHGRVWIILEQNGFELAQRFHRGVGARMLVGVDHFLAAAAPHGDRDDLFGQNAVLLRGHRALVRRSPRVRPVLDARCRTGGAGSPRSPAFRRAPDSGDHPRWSDPGPARRARARRCAVPPHRMSVE